MKPNARQREFTKFIAGANQNAPLSAAQLRVARERRFVYDGSLAPTCLVCGGSRDQLRGLKCSGCEQEGRS